MPRIPALPLRLLWSCLLLALAVVCPVSKAASVGDHWSLRNPFPTNEDLRATACNGTQTVVAVGHHGTILFSTTGTSWTQIATSTHRDLQDVIFNGTRYVAVGYDGAMLWSYDGNNWTVLPEVNAAFTSVTWTGTQFVAAGGEFSTTTGWGGIIYTSPDGMTWTRRSIVGAPYFFSITNNGTTIAAAGNGFVYTSTNGIAWTKRTLPKPTGSTTAAVVSIASVGGEFRLTGETVWASATGAAWGERTDLNFLIGMTLRWTGNELIATHRVGRYYTSSDAVNWADRSGGLITPPLAAGRFGTSLLNLSYGGHLERQVTPGLWTATNTLTVPANILGLAASPAKVVAVGKNISMDSATGSTWSEHYLSDTDMSDVTWDGSQFVAAGNGAWKSPDGAAWTNTIAPFTANARFFTVANVAGKTYACGYNLDSNQVVSAVTPDGTNWTAANMNNVVLGFATDGVKIVGVGWQLGVITSTDGTNWTLAYGGNVVGEDFTSVTYGGGQFVAVTSRGFIYTSATGTSWILRQGGATMLKSVTRTSNEYFAVGNLGLIIRSFDGVQWRLSENPTSTDINRVLWNGSRLVTVGTSGNIFTSDGTAAVQTTVSLSCNTTEMAETGGSAEVTLTLSQASPIAVTVPLGFTGSSTNNVDYTSSVQTVEFAPGDLTKKVTLTTKNDTLDEPDESLIITALQPTGDAALGATITHTLSILDDDSEPIFGAPLVDQLVALGTPVSFSAPATGTAPIAYQWKKNGATVAGAKAATYLIAKAAPSHAGEYWVEGKNISGTVPSSKAKLGVVTVSNQVKIVKAGTAITFSASAAGAVGFKWRNISTGTINDGGRFLGSDTAKLTITGLTPDDSGSYVCDVTLGALTLASTTVDLGVADALPVFAGLANVETQVARQVDLTPPFSQFPHKFVFKDLPPGLTGNTATGRITGKPTKEGTWNVKVTATNLYGTAAQATFNIVVSALPTPVVGSFLALMPRDPANNHLGGRVEVTTMSDGSFTGKVALTATAYSFKGGLIAPPAGDPGAQLTVSRGSKLPALIVSFAINRSTGAISSTVTAGALSHSGVGQPRAAAGSSRTGSYNIALATDPDNPEGSPEGAGYVQFAISATGAFTAAGRLPDDMAFSSSSIIAADGSIPVFGPAYADKGSVLGALTLHEDADSSFANNYVNGSLEWYKAATGTGRSYPGGIAENWLAADGGRYTAPTTGQVVMNLAGPAHLDFSGANLNLASRDPDNTFTVASPAKVTATAAITAATTLKFDTVKGLFSGQFSLNDLDTSILPNKPLPRTVKYYGVLIRPGGLPVMKGAGYFNLAQMPTAVPKTKSTTSPMLSGGVSLTPVAAP